MLGTGNILERGCYEGSGRTKVKGGWRAVKEELTVKKEWADLADLNEACT